MASDLNVTGVVRGNAIELDRPIGLSDGQRVEITVQTLSPKQSGDGIRASAGAWADADDDEFNHWLDDVYQSRRTGRAAEEP